MTVTRPTRRPKPSPRPGRAHERGALHPARLLRLFRRAGWLARAAAVVLLGLMVVGVALLVTPFTVDRPHPVPPPLTLRMACPPALVSAVAGAGGMANPVPSVDAWEDAHDEACGDAGRSRAVSGVLLAGAGLLNAAAVLEWSRVRRRARRARRRSAGGRSAA